MILLFLVFFCLCIDPVASQQTQEQLQLPSPLFAIVDVETTGLNPSFNEMIDIGLILVNTNLQEQGRFYRKIHPTQSRQTNRAHHRRENAKLSRRPQQ